MTSLRITTWNINGLSPNTLELEAILCKNKLDIMLISESHATSRSSFRIRGYNIYATPHPDGGAHAGTAVIIKSNIKHSILEEHSMAYVQATTVRLEDRAGPITVSAIYCLPKHKISEEMFTIFFETLGHRFIAGGDWNAKHTFWGSRCTITRGIALKSSVDNNNLRSWSDGNPTYWPSDPKKVPDLLDFFISGGMSNLHLSVESCLDGSSDHTPVILNISSNIITTEKPESLHNFKTDWEGFRAYLEDNLNLKMALQSPDDIEDACKCITNLIQVACWINTPELEMSCKLPSQPLEVKRKIEEKRHLRRAWHLSHHSSDKTKFNRAAKELKVMLRDTANISLQKQISMLSTSDQGEHSLWKAVKNLDKSQNHNPPIRSSISLARTDKEKAEIFGLHLASVFKPNEGLDQQEVEDILNRDFQLCLPIRPTSPKEIAKEIRSLNTNKAPGFDLITPRVLKELPKKAVTFLATLFNGIFRTGYVPNLWKISLIIMLHKPGKPAHDVTSYRPISLTPVLSKLWERIFLSRLKVLMDECELVPAHQFGFRKSHSTTEQVHRVYHAIRQSFEKKEYTSAAFLDVQQAFDRVWHKGLLCKVKEKLPHSVFPIIASYLEGRQFQAKQGDERSCLYNIEAGVPQGSVLGPVLYNIFTSDLPTTADVTVATYVDDVAYLASAKEPDIASNKLQTVLDKMNTWLQKWRICASAQKSSHITFTLRRGDCPTVTLGDKTLPHTDCVKYLGFHLDKRLTWKTHIKQKREHLNAKYKNLYWLMGRNSVLSLDNKLLLYNSVLKPKWSYGIQLWGVASKSNIMCLQRAQNAILRNIVNAPWFTRNEEIHDYLNTPTIFEEINKNKKRYADRLAIHPNPLAVKLLDSSKSINRLKRGQVI